MGLILTWVDYIVIIALNPVIKTIGINLMGLSAPWENYFVIIALDTVKQLIGLSDTWDESLEIISLDPINKNYEGLTKWALVNLGPTLLILLPCSQ